MVTIIGVANHSQSLPKRKPNNVVSFGGGGGGLHSDVVVKMRPTG